MSAASSALLAALCATLVVAPGAGFSSAARSPVFDAEGFARLAAWVEKHGGRVQPGLALAAPAPCGAARGIVTTLPVSEEVATERPLIVVPESLELNGLRALAVLEPLVPREVLKEAPLATLDDLALVTMLLAYERGLGPKSFYAEYIASLPEVAPCAWAMDEDELLRAITTYGAVLDTRGWMLAVYEAQGYAERVSRGIAGDYGAYLNITAEDVEWALGVVNSRSMGGAALVPLLDLLNYHHEAHPFTGHNGIDDAIRERAERLAFGDDAEATDEDKAPLRRYLDSATAAAPTTLEGSDWAWWSFQADGSDAVALAPGDECYANYLVEGYTPFDWFLSLGFVPVDALPEAETPPSQEL